MTPDLRLEPARLLGGLRHEEAALPWPGVEGRWYKAHQAEWFSGEQQGDGLEYSLRAGALAQAAYLSVDFWLDGTQLAVFRLSLQEEAGGPQCWLVFGLLNQCSARLRLPLSVLDQNRLRLPREGALLKPVCGGQRVDLKRVDRLTLGLIRKGDQPVRWAMTSLQASPDQPPRLDAPVLPGGPLLDEMGQSRLHHWPTRTRHPAEVTQRLHRQAALAPSIKWPEGFSECGGWSRPASQRHPSTGEGAASGYFRTWHDGRRWWLLDPQGDLFWFSGLNCVRTGECASAYAGLEKALSWQPDPAGPYEVCYEQQHEQPTFNYLVANFVRAFKPANWFEAWGQIALGHLRDWGFNTAGNWSEWELASRAGMPYVRSLNLNFERVERIFRDFPDVFDPAFAQDAADFARQLHPTAHDANLVGYFLTSEPAWGFAAELPAAGMLYTSPASYTRLALRDFLQQRYQTPANLTAAWGIPLTFESFGAGRWTQPLPAASQPDLTEFSQRMVEQYFGTLSRACREVAPHHLNLGVCYHNLPPRWVWEAMRFFDVFSFNCYQPQVEADKLTTITQALRRPVLIGEWHVGALDAGLPASGLVRVDDQLARARAFRYYLEDAASLPCCIGAHYFTMYDQSALGRFDGENYNIGFIDICNRPYEPLAQAARLAHSRMYGLAAGQLEPYRDKPVYRPRLFL